MTNLILGCGYLGRRVAELWLRSGNEVIAVTRTDKAAAALARNGLMSRVADITKPKTLSHLPDAHVALIAVGFNREAGPSIHEVYVQGLLNILAALPPSVRHLVYISSTGVYGQRNGEWVDETSPCEPIRTGGQACLQAERVLWGHPRGKDAVILRLGGIYGPCRVPRLQSILLGEPIATPTEGYLNLIHVEDAARAVQIAAKCDERGSLYCLTDNKPVRREEYYRYLARLLDAPEPRFVAPPAGAHVTQRAMSNKRVDSRRFQQKFDFEPVFPSYREGLQQALAGGTPGSACGRI